MAVPSNLGVLAGRWVPSDPAHRSDPEIPAALAGRLLLEALEDLAALRIIEDQVLLAVPQVRQSHSLLDTPAHHRTHRWKALRERRGRSKAASS